MNPELPGPVAVSLSVVVIAAAAGGLAVGVIGWPFLAAMVALPVVVGIFYRPFLGVLLLVATIPVENILNVGGFGVGRAIGLVLFAAWLVQKLAHRQSWHRVVSSGFFAISMTFLAWVLASMLWAQHPLAVRSGFIRLAQMVALALVVIDLADSRRRVDLVAKTLVLSALAAAGTTLYQYEMLGLRRAGADVAGGVNGTAMLLVTVIPLGFYLLRRIGGSIWKLVGTLFLGIAVVSVVTTLSRFNILLLAPTIALCYLLAIRERRARGWLLTVAAVGTTGAVLFMPWEQLEKRAATIDTYAYQTLQFGRGDAVTSPRGYHMRIGLAIARDHPLVGVGYDNYGYYFRDEYQFQVPGADQHYSTVRNPHSAYLGMLADLGAIGLSLWLALLTLCAVGGIRAWRRARAAGLRELVALIEPLVVMLGLHIFAYGFYGQNQVEKLVWIIMSLCVAMGYVVSTETMSAPSGDRAPSSRLGFQPPVHIAESPQGARL